MSWIYLYDEDERDVKTARRQLIAHGIGTQNIRQEVNRIEIFEAIAAAEEVVVALIDLQSDDRTDNNYSGHRVIETIRRNPELATRCQPIAYTVHARTDIIDLAQRHGAKALISKHDLDVPAAEMSDVDLAGFLEDQRRLPALTLDPDGDLEEAFTIFPDIRRAQERFDSQEMATARALDRVLQGTPRIVSRPYFWQAVRYLAEGIDSGSVAHWIHADFRAPSRTVEKDLEDLRGYLEPRYLIHGVKWADFARDLLEAAPQKRLAPSDLEMVRVLQRVSVLEDLLHDPEIRKESYLDDAALLAIDRVVDPLVGIGRQLGRAGEWRHVDDLLKRLATVEPREDARRTLQVDFVRGVSNMYDTYLARQSRT
jgi:CheY-like chemotaxis protein